MLLLPSLDVVALNLHNCFQIVRITSNQMGFDEKKRKWENIYSVLILLTAFSELPEQSTSAGILYSVSQFVSLF